MTKTRKTTIIFALLTLVLLLGCMRPAFAATAPALSHKTKNMTYLKSFQLKLTGSTAANRQSAVWTSSNPKVAKLTKVSTNIYKVKALSLGSSTITVKVGGKKLTCEVKVTSIAIPKGMGTYFTYMGWQCITAAGSPQYMLRTCPDATFSPARYAAVCSRYVIATTPLFGEVGDLVDVYLENGLRLKCIIGDIKSPYDSDCNVYGHDYGRNIVEFIVDRDTWYSTAYGGQAASMHANPGTNGAHPEWASPITKIVNYKYNYFEIKGYN